MTANMPVVHLMVFVFDAIILHGGWLRAAMLCACVGFICIIINMLIFICIIGDLLTLSQCCAWFRCQVASTVELVMVECSVRGCQSHAFFAIF